MDLDRAKKIEQEVFDHFENLRDIVFTDVYGYNSTYIRKSFIGQADYTVSIGIDVEYLLSSFLEKYDHNEIKDLIAEYIKKIYPKESTSIAIIIGKEKFIQYKPY